MSPTGPTAGLAPWTADLAARPFVRALRDALARGEVAALSGLVGPARLLTPLLATDLPLLVVVPTEREVERAADDLRTLARDAGAGGLVLPFPAPGPAPFRGLPRHAEASLQRAAALHAALRGRLRALVASPAGLLRPVLAPRLFETRVVTLQTGDEMTPEILLEALDEGGYRREDPVTAPGQVARRGGILDLFPPDRESPVRVEFLGDTLESLRAFDPETQRTTDVLDALEVLPLTDVFAPRSVGEALVRLLRERFPPTRETEALVEKIERGLASDEEAELIVLVPGATVPAWAVLAGWAVASLDPDAVTTEAEAFHERAAEERTRRADPLAPPVEEALVSTAALRARLHEGPAVHLREVDVEGRGGHAACRPAARYAGDLRRLAADLRSRAGATVLYLGTPGRAERLRDVLREDGLAVGEGTPVEVRVGVLSTGFELPEADLAVLADGDVFPEEVHLHRRRGARTRSFLSDFRDLKLGDLVVHEDHGIGRFEGLETLEVGGLKKEFMVLVYQGGDKLKVPVESFDRVQKYASREGARPVVDKLGSAAPGSRRSAGSRRPCARWRRSCSSSTPSARPAPATPSRARARGSASSRRASSTRRHPTRPPPSPTSCGTCPTTSPMDRLICGDVGYGKTEVAMRGGHARGPRRASRWRCSPPPPSSPSSTGRPSASALRPSRCGSRWSRASAPPKEIEGRRQGHRGGRRSTSSSAPTGSSAEDVAFRDLGLLVIDEEQRFGVAAKEKLKHLRTTVDCLTLSATPIPRTLQMGLAGIRDMSVIETPPKDRLAIQTAIVKFSTDVIATAIRQELRARRAGLLRAQPRGVHLLAGQHGAAPGAGGTGGGGPRPDAGGASSRRPCSPSWRAGRTCSWPPPSSRTASTSRAPTR